MHQGQKHWETAPGEQVLSPTRGKNPGKLPLVVFFKERIFCQKPHSEHLTKSPLGHPDAPGAKTLGNCPWWVCFWADQGQKTHKTAPGRIFQRTHILSKASFSASYKITTWSARCTRGKNPAKLPLVKNCWSCTSDGWGGFVVLKDDYL